MVIDIWGLIQYLKLNSVNEAEKYIAGLFVDDNASLICLYNCKRFELSDLVNAMIVHPYLIVESHLEKNFYFTEIDKETSRRFSSNDILGVLLNAIRERNENEKNLNNVSHFLSSVFNGIQDGISVLDSSLTILQVNNFMNRWYAPNLPLEGKKCYEVYHNAQKPCTPCPTIRAIKSGKTERDIVPGLPGSDVEWIDLYAYPMKNPDTGKVDKVVEIVRDITDIKKTNDALKEAKEKYEKLFQFSNDAIFLHDLSGSILDVNHKAAEIFGYSPDELTSMNVMDLHPEEELEKANEAFERIIKKGFIQFEINFKKKNGDLLPAEVSSSLIEIGGKRIVQGIVRDISDRKAIENEIRKNAQRLEILYNISQFKSESIQELLDFTMHSAIELTGSNLGYLYYYDEEEELFTLNSWSREAMEECRILNPQTTYELSKTGIWGEVIRQRKPIILNDFQADNSLKKGYPDGHVNLERWMAIPVFWNNAIVATIGVANKAEDYTESDVRRLTLIMDSVWKIIEHRKTTQALEQSEQRYRAIVEDSNDAIYLLVNDRFEMINRRFTEVFGYDIEDLNKPDFNLISLYAPESIPLIEERAQKIEKGEDVEPIYEFVAVAKDGRKVYCETSVSYIQYGETVATQGIIRDITERKQAEQKIRESEQRLRHLIEQTPLGVIEWDRGSRVIEWNHAAEKIFGYKKEEALGRHAGDLIIPEEIKGQILSIWNALLRQTGGRRSTNENITRDGRRIICEWYNTPLVDAKGNVYAVASLVEDVTKQMRAQEALIDSEQRFRNLFDGASDSMIIHDIDGKIVEVNQTACEQYGYTKSEFASMNLKDLCLPERQESLNEKTRILFKENRSVYEIDHIKKDGTSFPVEVHANLIRLRGSSMGLMSVRDLSDRKKLQEQLYQSQKMETVGLLAGGVAHDFNNILSVVTGYSSMLLDDLKPEDPLYADLKEILDAAERGSMLTQQLLAFSRKQVLEPEVLNTNEVITQLEKMLLRVIGEDIQLSIHLTEEIKPIKVDRGKLEQVIINLAVNARDAMPSGGKLVIETSLTFLDTEYTKLHPWVKPGEYILISISDTGTGIPPEIRDRIFEPFFTTKERGKGTGLGLATVYGIIKQSGGFIFVYSETGEGTTFKIYFPVTSEQIDQEKQQVISEQLSGTETILVAEDDEKVRDLIQRALERYGYTVIVAGKGKEAISLCRKYTGTVHLLCTDVVMPEMNGRELARRIQAITPDIKVLYMSGYTDNMIVHHGILKKGINFINKPFSPSELLRKVRSVLDQR